MKRTPINSATSSHMLESHGVVVVDMFMARGTREDGNCMQPSLLTTEKDNSSEVVREEAMMKKVEQRLQEGRVIQQLQPLATGYVN